MEAAGSAGGGDVVRIRPWAPLDLGLLGRLTGDPAMTAHLGGPETPEMIQVRHGLYLSMGPDDGEQFVVTVGPGRSPAGWVGYWARDWHGQPVWEAGWSVLPEYQGRGVATRATAELIERARAAGRRRFLHAFPSPANAPSNAICRRLGFELLGEVDFEYPPGRRMRSNDWRLDLRPAGSTPL